MGVSVCMVCGRDYVGTRVSQKYCRPKCRYKAWYVAHRTPPPGIADFSELRDALEREKGTREGLVGYSLVWHGIVGFGNQFPDPARTSRHDDCKGGIRFSSEPYWAIEPMALPKVPRDGRYSVWVWQRGQQGITKHRVAQVEIPRSHPSAYFYEGDNFVLDPRGVYATDRNLIRWPRGQPRPRPEGAKRRVRRAKQAVATELPPTPQADSSFVDLIVERVTRAVLQAMPVQSTLPDQTIAELLKRVVDEQLARHTEQSRRTESELNRENAELRQRLQSVHEKKQVEPGLSAEVAALKSMVSELRQQLQATVAEMRADREASAKRESELARERDAARAEAMQLQATLTLIVRERDLAVARLQKLAKSEPAPPIAKSAPSATIPTATPPTAKSAPSATQQAAEPEPSVKETGQTPVAAPLPAQKPMQSPTAPPAAARSQPSIPPTVLGLFQQARQARTEKSKHKKNRR